MGWINEYNLVLKNLKIGYDEFSAVIKTWPNTSSWQEPRKTFSQYYITSTNENKWSTFFFLQVWILILVAINGVDGFHPSCTLERCSRPPSIASSQHEDFVEWRHYEDAPCGRRVSQPGNYATLNTQILVYKYLYTNTCIFVHTKLTKSYSIQFFVFQHNLFVSCPIYIKNPKEVIVGDVNVGLMMPD